MDLGGEASPGPAQAVVVGFDLETAWRFLLGLPIAAGARGVLVGPADRGVDVDLPRDQPSRVRPGLPSGQQFRPGAVALPAAEKSVDRLPRPVVRREISPRSTSPHAPLNTVDQIPSARRRSTQHRNRQQRLQYRPLHVRKIPSPHTKIITTRDEEQAGFQNMA